MSTLDSINKYAVGSKANEEAYADLRATASACYVADHSYSEGPAQDLFTEATNAAEIEFMDLNYSNDPDAVHTKGARKGTYKFRTYLPRAYSTARSTLSKALGAGIDPSDMGKTALEKKYKELTATTKSPETLVQEALATLLNRIDQLPAADREAAVRDTATVLDNLLTNLRLST